jgi:SAM-dependent methyltransferase
MIFELLRLSIDITDEQFDAIYPGNIRPLAYKHWTPVAVAKTASGFLVGWPGSRVLDIGSGAGKFCMVGASVTKGHFTGVEQREELVELSRRLSASYFIPNVKFIHANIMSVNFRDYDSFYFYNPFHENIALHDRIDGTVALNARLFDMYSQYTFEQLSCLARGARLATYNTPVTSVPRSFRLVDCLYNGSLSLWEKTLP